MKPNPQTTAELYDATADEITAHILGYLRSKGYVCWAQDNRGRYNPKTGKWYPHPNNRVGVPDILGYRKSDARFIGVEVKAGKDRLSDYQIDFLNELKEHGGLPFVAYSFEGFVQSFERRGLHLVATTAAPTEAVPECRRWIAVADQVPEHGEYVLTVRPQHPHQFAPVTLGRYDNGGWWIRGEDYDGDDLLDNTVTHWQPLPQSPSK